MVEKLMEQAELLEGLSSCMLAVARSMENGDMDAVKGAAAMRFAGKEMRRISGAIMEIQAEIDPEFE